MATERIMETEIIVSFDYQQLDIETQAIIRQEDEDFDRNIEGANNSFVLACQNLLRIHEALRYKRPGFEEYCHSKSLPTPTAYKMLNVAEMSINFIDFPVGQIAKSALYLLAEPSTPEEIRTEILQRAQDGETILYTETKEIVDDYKQTNNRQKMVDTPAEYVPGWLDGKDDDLIPDDEELIDDLSEQVEFTYKNVSQPVQVTIFSSETEEYYTPPQFIEAAREVLGIIDLDPATCEMAQKWIMAESFYTIENDGLSQKWHGKVWLNPPYGKDEGKSNQGAWSQKLIAEYKTGNVSEAILLVKAAVGYNWFEILWDDWPVCFVRERLSFIKEDGSCSGQSKQGTAFFYFGPNVEKFKAVFSKFGRIIMPEVGNETL